MLRAVLAVAVLTAPARDAPPYVFLISLCNYYLGALFFGEDKEDHILIQTPTAHQIKPLQAEYIRPGIPLRTRGR